MLLASACLCRPASLDRLSAHRHAVYKDALHQMYTLCLPACLQVWLNKHFPGKPDGWITPDTVSQFLLLMTEDAKEVCYAPLCRNAAGRLTVNSPLAPSSHLILREAAP